MQPEQPRPTRGPASSPQKKSKLSHQETLAVSQRRFRLPPRRFLRKLSGRR
jgi:hypothetical protein